jgi:hypothetical protein
MNQGKRKYVKASLDPKRWLSPRESLYDPPCYEGYVDKSGGPLNLLPARRSAFPLREPAREHEG